MLNVFNLVNFFMVKVYHYRFNYLWFSNINYSKPHVVDVALMSMNLYYQKWLLIPIIFFHYYLLGDKFIVISFTAIFMVHLNYMISDSCWSNWLFTMKSTAPLNTILFNFLRVSFLKLKRLLLQFNKIIFIFLSWFI